MKIKTFLIAAFAVCAALVIEAAPAQAQSCYQCSDEFWTEISCEPAGWMGSGQTSCEVESGSEGPRCNLSGGVCWGPDPEEQDFALNLGADGTLMNTAVDPRGETLSAHAMGLSEMARINERTCKGFITLRVYGAALRKDLQKKAVRITI